ECRRTVHPMSAGRSGSGESRCDERTVVNALRIGLRGGVARADRGLDRGTTRALLDGVLQAAYGKEQQAHVNHAHAQAEKDRADDRKFDRGGAPLVVDGAREKQELHDYPNLTHDVAVTAVGSVEPTERPGKSGA